MGFREQLEAVVGSVEGAIACSLMGYDGIAVDSAERPADGDSGEIDVQSLLIEFSNILGQIRNAAEQLRTGGASEVQIRTEKIVAVARFLTPEYFLALAVAPDANLGRARYLLRVAAPKIAAEL